MAPEGQSPPPRLPLEGVRVINFGWYWVCGVITHLLADMGAEVIKFDSWARLEVVRRLAPMLGGIEDPNRGMWPHNTSRNNLGVTVNLGTEQGRELTRRLIEKTDVVAENWVPGTMKKLGLDYETLRARNPRLVMISASAAGQSGPLHNITTFGNVLSSLTGLDSMQGYEGERPVSYGLSITDPTAGILGACAVLAALRRRDLTGEGAFVDFSQWEAMSTTIGAPLLDYAWNGRVHAPLGNHHPFAAPHNLYRCAGEDDWLALAVFTAQEWRGLCRAMGEPSWCAEPRFADTFRRKRNEDALDERIGAWTREREHHEIAALLQANGVRAFPALSARELYTDAHFRDRGAWVQVQHALGPEWVYGVH